MSALGAGWNRPLARAETGWRRNEIGPIFLALEVLDEATPIVLAKGLAWMFNLLRMLAGL
jgi:hypothetical protein